MSTPVKAAYKLPGKVIIFILTFLHCIQKTKLRFFRSPLFETCALAAGDFPQAGTLGSNETMCCGIFWLGGKLSRYCRCWMYLMANLFWGRKTDTQNWLKYARGINSENLTEEIRFLTVSSLEVCTMVAWPSRVQMICSCPSCERALGHRLSACIALEDIAKIIGIRAGASSRIGMEKWRFYPPVSLL